MSRHTTPTLLIGTNLGGGAISQQNAALAGRLSDLGYSVSLLIHGPQDSGSLVDPRVTVIKWPSPRPTRPADAFFFDRLLRRTRPCCLISNFGANVVMMTVGALRRVPVRIRWHHTLSSQIEKDNERGSRFSSFLGDLRTRLFFSFATHVVANSNAAKQDLLNTFHVPERRCQVFWNALSDPLGNPDMGKVAGTENTGRNLFVCAGRLSPSKGQDVLLRALSLVVGRLPDITVDFIGDGPARRSCENLAAELGISSHCCFSGKLPHPDVLKRMSGARATIVPSRTEAFGLVNIESMSLGVPVIGSNTGGIAEIVRDGIDGLLFPPGDHEGLARCLFELAQNDSLHAQLGASSRKRFLESFELSQAVKAQADWISQLIKASVQGPRQQPL